MIMVSITNKINAWYVIFKNQEKPVVFGRPFDVLDTDYLIYAWSNGRPIYLLTLQTPGIY